MCKYPVENGINTLIDQLSERQSSTQAKPQTAASTDKRVNDDSTSQPSLLHMH